MYQHHYTANVIKCDNTVVKVNGTQELEDSSVINSEEFEYKLKCYILFKHFKPGEAVGTDNVTLL